MNLINIKTSYKESRMILSTELPLPSLSTRDKPEQLLSKKKSMKKKKSIPALSPSELALPSRQASLLLVNQLPPKFRLSLPPTARKLSDQQDPRLPQLE